MSQQQRQYLGLVTKLLAKAVLQLGGSEQELISAWCISQTACTIMPLSASTLPSFLRCPFIAMKVCKKSWSASSGTFWVFIALPLNLAASTDTVKLGIG
jgi:hypothetical protein